MNKFHSLAFFLIAVCLVFAYSYTLDTKLDVNGDNATYITLARNLAAGHGYTRDTANGYIPVNHFPPGYPAILSVFIRMGIDNLVFFKVLNAVFLFLSLCLLYLVFADCTRQRWLCASVAILLCFSIYLLHFAGMAMSEMSYLFFVSLSVFSIWKYSQKDTRFYSSPWFWVAIVSAIASYYMRSVGIALMLSVIIFLLFRRQWLASLSAACSMGLMMLPWSLRNAHYGLHARYLGTVMTVNPWRPEEGSIDSVGGFFSKMMNNLDQTVVRGFPKVLFNVYSPDVNDAPATWWMIVLGLIVLVVVIWGAWNTGKLRFLMLPLLLGNIGLLAIWHGGNGVRYVAPLTPFVAFFFYNGVMSAFRLFRKLQIMDDSRWGLLALLAAIPLLMPLDDMHKASAKPYPPALKQYFHMATIADSRLSPRSVVCCRKPELFGYQAPHLLTVKYLFDPSPEKVIRQMIDDKVDYVVLDVLGLSSQGLYLEKAMRAYPDLFLTSIILENPDTVLFRFDRQLAEAMFP